MDVEAVNRKTGDVLFSDGQLGRVTTWIGADGETLKSSRDALVCVARGPGGWWVIDLRQFKAMTPS